MATIESEAKAQVQLQPEAAAKPKDQSSKSILDSILALLSSVRFGVTLLMILLACSIIGMVIMQTNVEGFHTYYSHLTPAQKALYGGLDFFDIYHSWYFELLLAITGLNIILASIDRFPTAWQYLAKPKVKAGPNFIKAQTFSAERHVSMSPKSLAEKVRKEWRGRGFRSVKVTEDAGRITVFAQRNLWNRFGAYVVHVILLTIFIGGFVTNRWGVGGMMEIVPGKTTNTFTTTKVDLNGDQTGTAEVPFQVECTDLRQELVDPKGSLDMSNTVDWLSYVKIVDKQRGASVPALVHLNEPFDYRGYRLFQSRFEAVGNARSITVSFVPSAGGQIVTAKVMRDQVTDVPGIGQVSYTDFFPDFTVQDGKPATASADYNNPVAQLRIVAPDKKVQGAFAFNKTVADQFYNAADGKEGQTLLVNGNKVLLDDFEKVGTAHILAVQYDPGRTPVYIGFLGLVLALCGVFFFAHLRVWAVIEPEGDKTLESEKSKVYFGGNTNRSRPAFESKFNSLIESVTN